jgi:hypothetical protein
LTNQQKEKKKEKRKIIFDNSWHFSWLTASKRNYKDKSDLIPDAIVRKSFRDEKVVH